MLDLAGCPSCEAFLETLAAAPPETPVLGHGARPEAWTDRGWPSASEADEATAGRPAAVWCFDFHAIFVNGAMLATLGIDRHTPDPKGGRIVRDERGEPTGVLLESAAAAAWDRLTPREVDESAVLAGLRDLSRFFVELHDLKAKPGLASSLVGLLEAEPIDLRIELYPLVGDLARALHAAPRSDRVRVAGGKIFVDGTLNSRTAWMLEPYADGPAAHPSGMSLMSPTEIDDAIRACAAEGLRLACHAIGDAAVRAVLDAVERVGPPRWTVRLEHAEVIDTADVPRFAELGVVASVQPCHLLTDIEVLHRALPDRLDRILPLRELIDAGLEPGRTLVFGSDAPIVRPDPEDSIFAATTRTRDGAGRVVAASQALSEAVGWACFDADLSIPISEEARGLL